MPFNLALSLTTLILSSLAILQQVDLKSFVALSSVAHIAIGTIGLLVLTEEGLGGAWVLSLAHGLVSPCLFLIMGGVIYQTLSTRLLYPLRGLSSALPLISGLLLLTLLINIGLPPFAS
jgi:NADH-ubiquinone oxidoreductase chain 4